MNRETDSMSPAYQYLESGLDNVFIEGLSPCTDDSGETCCAIPNINQLHRAIAEAIVGLPQKMSGAELRFLRTEMGMTQAELARIVHRQPLEISRWERAETEIDDNAEVVLRFLAVEKLELLRVDTVPQMSARVVKSAVEHPIRIDGSNPDDYRPLAA